MKNKNNDEKIYLFGMKLGLLIPERTNLDESDRKDKDLILSNREVWGDKEKYHSSDRKEVTKLNGGCRNVYSLLENNRYSDRNMSEGEKVYGRKGISVTLEELEKKFVSPSVLYDTMYELWRMTRGGNFMITHKTKWDTWSDSLRYIRKLNPQTYSDAAYNDRNNAYIINADTIETLWEENHQRWLHNKNNKESRNKSISNVNKCKSVVRSLNGDIQSLERAIENGTNVKENITREDLVSYAIAKLDSGIFSTVCYSEGSQYRRSKLGDVVQKLRHQIDSADAWVRTGVPFCHKDTITIEDISEAKKFIMSEPNGKLNLSQYTDSMTVEDLPTFAEYAALAQKRHDLKERLEKMLKTYTDNAIHFSGIRVWAKVDGEEE